MPDWQLEHLDELERQEPDSISTETVLDLMEAMSQTPDGIRLLVQRYGGSQNPVIVRSLSFLVAQEAGSGNPKAQAAIFALIESLKCREDQSTLINSLTAVHRSLIYDNPVEPNSKESSALFDFLMHCLDQSVLVQSTALRVLSQIHDNGMLGSLFRGDQIAALHAKLVRLSSLGDEFLNDELKGIIAFLTRS